MKFVTSLLLGLLAVTPISYAKTLTAAQDPWAPFVTNSPSMPGLSVELATAAFKTQGYDLKFTIMPWMRALNSVKQGKIDVLPAIWYTSERTEYFLFSQPYLENDLTFIKRTGDSFEYNGLDSLSGKTVGVVKAYGYGDDFLAATNFRKPESGDLVSNLKKLLAKRIDLTIEDKIVAQATIKEAGLPAGQFEFSQNSLSSNPLHVAVSKANPEAAMYVEAFEKGMDEIKANGVYAQIMGKYGIQ